ncbi:class I SAM-dependent methyltransferase [Streptomyces violascens]|uniref:class I SAM-dependent methyltransferase n=1 Tax=Streptomyces violascens TaxID=67381 RepID=UPI003647975E
MSTPAVLPDAKAWTEWYGTGTSVDRIVSDTEAEKFMSRVAPTNGSRAVDLGCGSGVWTRRLGWWGMHVVGYDYAVAAIEQAERQPRVPEVSYELWDVNSEPIPVDLTPGSVDLVTCRLSLAYMDVNRLLVDVGRWLAPWGVFYALTPVMDKGDGKNDPYQSALTFAEFESLGTAWSRRQTWPVGPRYWGISLSGFTSKGRSSLY